MPVPAPVHEAIEPILDEYCRQAVPAHAQDKVRIGYTVRGMAVTLHESRPNWKDESQWLTHNVARFRYTKKHDHWTLYWRDRNLKWHIYNRIEPDRDFGVLLEEVIEDPTGIFWG